VILHLQISSSRRRGAPTSAIWKATQRPRLDDLRADLDQLLLQGRKRPVFDRLWRRLALKKRLGFKRAAVALARKLAVVLHVMWKTGKNFDPNHRLAAA
jgi:hypothetical protein